MTLDHINLVTHPWTDVVSEGNVGCKDVHVWAALKCARDIFTQRPAATSTIPSKLAHPATQKSQSTTVLPLLSAQLSSNKKALKVKGRIPNSCAKVSLKLLIVSLLGGRHGGGQLRHRYLLQLQLNSLIETALCWLIISRL